MTLSRRSLLAFAAALSATGLCGLEAQADEIGALLAKIGKARAKLRTLQAPFKQIRVIGLLASKVESRGTLTLVLPGRLRWELAAPDSVTYWIGPEGLTMRNDEGVSKLGHAAAGRFAAVLGDLLIMLGGDMRKLRKRYELGLVEEDGHQLLTAKPIAKAVAKHIALLSLRLAGDEGWVDRIEIRERNGDKSIIALGKLTKNEPVADEVIKPPK
jgi:hypothetical protein